MHATIKKFFILLTTVVCLYASKTYASHYAAADITVDYIGTSPNDLTYKITLAIYKACEPGNSNLATAENIHINSVNAGFNITWSVVGGQLDTLDQLCDFAKPQNSCRQPASLWPAFVRRIYDTTITLPSRQVDWIFWWSSNARNAGISNLVAPAGDIYIEAGINNVFANNSAPRFLVAPLPYICVNKPAFYLNGPFDPDGDSLEVVHHAPLFSATTPYAFKAPSYSFANPIASTATNPYTVNPSTGTATFTPTLTGLHVLAFRCNEYQPGTGIPTGHVFRDVQLTILNCTADAPDIDTIPKNLVGGVNTTNTAQGSTIVACPNTQISFDVTASSKSNSNKVIIEANNATISSSSFVTTNNGTSKATGSFSWTPGSNDIGNHTLIISAKDSTCDNTQPIVLYNYRVYLIKVIKGIDAGPDLTLCAEGGVAKEIFVRNSEGLNLTWTPSAGLDDPTGHAPKAKPVVTTEYIVNAANLPDGCKNKDTVVVNVDTSNSVTIFPANPVLCKPDYLQLEALTKGRPPLTNMACGTANPVNCAIPDSVSIFSLLSGDFDTLGGSTPTFDVDVKTEKRQFLIRKAEMWESGLRSATIRSISFNVALNPDPTYLYSNFKISMMCTDKNSLNRANGFETGAVPVYTSPADITLAQGWHKFTFDVPYSWDTSKNLIIEICYSNNAVIGTAANNPIIKFVATNYPSALTLKSSTATSVCATTTAAAIGDNLARPLFGFTYCESPAAPFEYTWTPSTFLSDSTIRQPLAYIPKPTRYTVKTIGRSGCIMSDTTDIYIPEHHYSVIPADTAVCYGETAPLRVQGGFAYKWYKLDDQGNYQLLYNATNKEASCYDCAIPELKPGKTTTYKIVVYDSVWCMDTLTAKITVLPLPDIRIINRDTVLKYGQSLQLLASGAKLYNWMPVGSLNNANISYPVASPTEPTTYIAGGIGSNGCRAFDTVRVDIDYRDNLFIPSAFSPNGDGKNDLFKVSNLTFQRIAEFRVFNRWGQEIFMANDNTGWDGNWKGEPQDMGTYTYQIRIGFPDGYVESYKGNITLIR